VLKNSSKGNDNDTDNSRNNRNYSEDGEHSGGNQPSSYRGVVEDDVPGISQNDGRAYHGDDSGDGGNDGGNDGCRGGNSASASGNSESYRGKSINDDLRDDPKLELLRAISPFMHDRRKDKIDDCVSILKMIRIMSALDAGGSGIFKRLGLI
jgi:hypothetical protein